MAAIELDGNFCDAYVLFCRSLFGAVFSNEYAHQRAENEALFTRWRNGHMIWTNNPEAVIALSRSYNIRRDYEKRVELAERALELNPNHPACNHDYGLAPLIMFRRCASAYFQGCQNGSSPTSQL